MSRFLSLILSAVLLLSLMACQKEESVPPESAVETVEPEPIPEPAPEPTPEELAAEEVEAILADMTVEEKVGQLFFVRCPAESAAEDVGTYHLGGYILFGRDFKDASDNWLTREQLEGNISSYQNAALNDTGIPLLIGSDEEGGTVTRASRNPNLFESKFKSPQAIAKTAHDQGDVFAEDAWERSNALLALGINVNLAPVCDVSTNPNDFIYDRTLGQDAGTTATFVASTVNAMKDAGIGSVLKHFPGYGNNVDTHTGIAIDERPYDQFWDEDFDPFRAGIEMGPDELGRQTTSVLVNHNIVTCMDPDLPASLSPEVHRILREELEFAGVVMTDDLAMDAVAAYSEDGAVAVMSIQAGNDLVLTSDYRTQIPKVLEAVENGTLSMEEIDTACRRVLTWKQALGLI
jgi:beta-N-acetylhexosaminidase